MTNELAELTKKLRGKQGDSTDVAFARTLSISRQLWALIKKGQHEPGTKFISAVMSKYPDLMLDVMNYLRTKQEHDSGEPIPIKPQAQN